MWENARVDFFCDTAEKTIKTLVWDTAGRPWPALAGKLLFAMNLDSKAS